LACHFADIISKIEVGVLTTAFQHGKQYDRSTTAFGNLAFKEMQMEIQERRGGCDDIE